MRVSIIGFGRFGQLLAALLREHHGATLELGATSRGDRAAAAHELGVAWQSVAEAASADVVILCVPIRALAETLGAIGDHVRPGALVLDTCSVKVYPAALLAAKMPAEVEVLATHPMFGPDGVRQSGIAGQRLVSWPVRVGPERLALVEGWFRAMGVTVLRMTPEEHDRQAAVSQGLVHLIGRAVAAAGFAEPSATTDNADRLFALTRSVAADSSTLFEDLETLNPFAAEARRAFLDAAQQLDQLLRRE